MSTDELADRLKKLADKATQLTQHTDEAYKLLRNVDQLENDAQRLAQGKKTGDPTQAILLLAKHGADTQKIERGIAAFEPKAVPSVRSDLAETNFEAFLARQQERIFSTAIQDVQLETINLYEREYEEQMNMDWKEAKKELLEILHSSKSAWGSEGPSGSSFDAKRSAPGSSNSSFTGIEAVGTAASPPTFAANFTATNEKKLAEFAKEVQKVCEARIEGFPIGVVNLFAAASGRVPETNTIRRQELVDTWELLRSMVGEESVSQKTGKFTDVNKVIPEKAYEALLKSRNADAGRLRLLTGARQFLEAQFRAIVDEEIRKQPQIARLGSQYKNDAKRGIDLPSRPSMEIYFALRIGDPSAAADIAKASKMLDIASYIQAWATDTVNDLMTSSIRSEYTRCDQDGRDPFRLLILNLVGRVDASKAFNQRLPGSRWTTQDYLWMTLHMIRDVSLSPPLAPSTSTITLSQFQSQMVQPYGAQYWQKAGKSPLIYFQILLLSLQFERAIDFLVTAGATAAVFSTPAALLAAEYSVEAFHLGMAMSYYGFLNEPATLRDLASLQHQFFVADKKQLNIVRLLRQFVAILSSRDLRSALEYCFFYSNLDIRHECIKELVMTSRAFIKLLGTMDAEAKIHRGLIFGYMPADIARNLIHEAALGAEHDGQFQEAASLYQIAEDHAQVLVLTSKQVSRVVNLPLDNPERIQLRQLATLVFAYYNKDNRFARIDQNAVKTFKWLCQLIYFYDLFYENLFQDALEHLKTLQLFPFADSELYARLEQFKTLAEILRRTFPRLLVDAMTCLHQTNSELRAHRTRSEADQSSRVFKEEARVLVKFAGLLNYQMPGDLNARLLSLEASIV